MSSTARFQAMRAKIAAIQGGGASARAVLSFGDPQLDGAFPAAGLPLGCWHEVGGPGLEIETAAASGAFVAALAGPLAGRGGALVWVMRRDDLHAPGLVPLGLPAGRLIQVRARDETQALAALEDALGSVGVAAAIGEVGRMDLTSGRRLQLACERRGATGFIILRRPFGGPRPADWAPLPGTVATTRWSVASAPSEPAAGAPGLGPPRWRADLERCRGGRPGRWILEKSDGAYPLRVVARLGDRQLEAPPPRRLVG